MTNRIRNGPILRERDRSKPRELTAVVLLCAAMSLPVFVYVWEQVTLYRIGQEIQAMERQKAELHEAGRRLDLERAQLVSLSRVETIARGKLGLVDGAPLEVLALDASGRVAARPQQALAELSATGRPPER